MWEMYRGQIDVCKMEITLMDITSHGLLSNSQEPSKCLFLIAPKNMITHDFLRLLEAPLDVVHLIKYASQVLGWLHKNTTAIKVEKDIYEWWGCHAKTCGPSLWKKLLRKCIGHSNKLLSIYIYMYVYMCNTVNKCTKTSFCNIFKDYPIQN